MTIISELASDAKFMIQFRKKYSKLQKNIDRHAPKVEDIAPDFTLYNVTGTESITLSDFRGKKPVALVVGEAADKKALHNLFSKGLDRALRP